MTTVTIRCPEELKKGAADVAKDFGLDLSSVTRAIWHQMQRTHSIPLNLQQSYEPNAASLQAIKETDEIISNGGPSKTFKSGKELLDEIDSS